MYFKNAIVGVKNYTSDAYTVLVDFFNYCMDSKNENSFFYGTALSHAIIVAPMVILSIIAVYIIYNKQPSLDSQRFADFGKRFKCIGPGNIAFDSEPKIMRDIGEVFDFSDDTSVVSKFTNLRLLPVNEDFQCAEAAEYQLKFDDIIVQWSKFMKTLHTAKVKKQLSGQDVNKCAYATLSFIMYQDMKRCLEYGIAASYVEYLEDLANNMHLCYVVYTGAISAISYVSKTKLDSAKKNLKDANEKYRQVIHVTEDINKGSIIFHNALQDVYGLELQYLN